MPRLPWVRPQRARLTRLPNAETSGEAPPNDYGLIRNRLFNDEASRNRAELEPIDTLTRSTTPHSGHVNIALGALAIGVVAWLTLGSVDRSLWLTGRIVDAPAATAQQNPSPGNLIRVEAEVPPSDADQLVAGTKVFLVRSNATGTFVSGTIRSVHPLAAAASPDSRVTLQLAIAHDPSSVFVPPGPGEEDYRLRIPVGTQRPVELLLGFARPRPAREP